MSRRSRPLDAEVVRGLELFAAGRFHAAHGAFERAWVARGRAAPALQALVQVAAACVHLDRGRLRPAERLMRRARMKLLEDPSAADYVRLEEVVSDLDACLEVVERHAAGNAHRPVPRSAYPTMRAAGP
jgi:predicted metal-dependent hydrolase